MEVVELVMRESQGTGNRHDIVSSCRKHWKYWCRPLAILIGAHNPVMLMVRTV